MLLSSKTFFSVACAIALVSCGKRKDPAKTYFDTAADYNQYISDQYDHVNTLWDSALVLMDDSLRIYPQLDSLEKTAMRSAGNMQKLADFKGDTMFKYRAQQYFIYMASIARGSFKQAVDIALMTEVPDSLMLKFDNIGHQIGSDKDTCINRLLKAQEDFITITQK